MTKRWLVLFGILVTALFILDAYELELDLGSENKANRLVFRLPFLSAWERQAYDIRMRLSAREGKHDTVVIIDVDEKSLLAEGQWPWPRAKLARLVDKLFDQYKVSTLGFDVLFAETEDSFTFSEIQQAIREQEFDATRLIENRGDALLANALSGRQVVLGYVFEPFYPDQTPRSVGQLPAPMFQDSEIPINVLTSETRARQAGRYSANIPILQNAAATAGFFSILEQDSDGVIRRVELLSRYKDQFYGSLALKLFETDTFDSAQPVVVIDPNDGYDGFEGLELLLPERPISLDASASVYVPYAKARQGFEYVSAVDVLSGRYTGNLAGTIAIIGTSSQGLGDTRSTPVAPALPGVEVHANLVAGLLDESFRSKPPWITGANVLILLFLGLLLSIALPFLSALWSTALSSVALLTVVMFNWYFWVYQYTILSLAPVLTLILGLYVFNTIVGFFLESAARRTSQKMFGLYVPPEVVSKMSEDSNIHSLKSERREMTVLFCDIRDFTSISESMQPEDLSDWLNRFLTPMTTIIHQHGGAIDKYMGDAIMAFWGAPLSDEKHAEHAVAAALIMVQQLASLNQKFETEGKPTIKLGIGINTGQMNVGNMGSEFRMAYTVVGDAVNLASRLEGLTKRFQVPIIVSEFTRAAAPDFNYCELERVTVKGKNKAVTVFSCQG